MPNLPGFHPELAQQSSAPLPTFRRDQGPRGRSVTPQAASLLDTSSLLSSRLSAPAEPSAYEAQQAAPKQQAAPEASSFFEQPNVLQELLDKAGQVRTQFDPTAVPSAREELLKAQQGTVDPHAASLSAMHGGAGVLAQLQGGNVDEAQSHLQEALRAQREAALGANTAAPQEAGDIRKQLDRLSWDEYNALTNRQRAAVDFNTMLVQAVRKDLHHQDDYKPSEVQKLTYQNSVNSMFGEDGGSETYAPETMTLLRKIGYSDDRAALDDFLGLKAAIGERDLKNLVPREVPGQTATGVEHVQETHPLRTDRVNLANTLATGTAELERTLARTGQLLATMPQTAALDRNDLLTGPMGLGGIPNTGGQLMTGYGPPEDANGQRTIDGYFQVMYDQIARKDGAGRDQVLAELNKTLHPDELKQFMAYVDTRSNNADHYNLQLGDTEGATYKKPERLRTELDLGGGY